MRVILIAALMVASSAVTAAALKFSDSHKVARAIEAIRMADVLAAGTPQSITCQVKLTQQPEPGKRPPSVTLDSGQSYTNLLTAITNKLNADKATAEAYLSSVGVTND